MKSQLVAGVNGMPKVALKHESGSTAEVYLNGAHVTSWIPAGGHEMIFLSEKAVFEPGKSIRGGIPVVFPQFADAGPLPKHGWLRTSEWTLRESSVRSDSVTLVTEESAGTLAVWPHPYHVELTVTLGESFLDVKLDVKNPGAEAFTFTSALHSYLSVGDTTKVGLSGLGGIQYVDKVKGGIVATQPSDPLRIDSEIDRVYVDAPRVLMLDDEARSTRLEIRSTGFYDAVVWNPWEEVSSGLADMAPGDYMRMLCVESGMIAKPVVLGATNRWSGGQRLTLVQVPASTASVYSP